MLQTLQQIVFTYTVSDGTATDTATLIFTVTGINDAPVAVNDTDAVNEDATVTRTSGDNLLMADDSDADDDDSFTVTQIAVTGSSDNAVTANSTYNSGSPETVTGTYGTLTVGADGTYTYVADQNAADDLDLNDQVTDSFTYTISDGTATDTATLIFTVTGINDAPVAVNDTDAVNEDATVTRTSGDSLLMADDSDADDDDSFTVTQIAVTGGSNSSVNSSTTYSNGTSVTGTYGTLVVGADGSYTYVADQSAADDLDVNDQVTDSFTYTISDGTATDTATLIFTVTGINDAPVAVNDTDAVNEDATVTRTSGDNLLMADDSDADDDDSFTVTQIAVTGGSNSSVAGSSAYNSNFTSVTGTYGTLKVGADGTYTYVADQSAADDLDAFRHCNR
jgi:VCBS repeat-containing protein